ncbi:MAG: glycerophosphodiester phosphodiesterase [Thermoanaerobaculia bacterium]
MHSFLIFGHRGSPRRAPENTIRSFEEAFRAGADGIETDLRLLTDGSAVLYHDDELDERDIETLAPADFKRRGVEIARVKDLAPFAARGTLVLEVKRGKWEDALLAEVGKWQNIVIASFDHSLIASLASRNLGIALGLTTFGHIVDLPSYTEGLGATWCFPSWRYVDEGLVHALRTRSIRVVPWTANRPREWERLRAMGCDGVITDVPDEAVRWRDSQPSVSATI